MRARLGVKGTHFEIQYHEYFAQSYSIKEVWQSAAPVVCPRPDALFGWGYTMDARLIKRDGVTGVTSYAEGQSLGADMVRASNTASHLVRSPGAPATGDLKHKKSDSPSQNENSHLPNEAGLKLPGFISPHEARSVKNSSSRLVKEMAARISLHCPPAHNWQTRRKDLQHSVRASPLLCLVISRSSSIMFSLLGLVCHQHLQWQASRAQHEMECPRM